MSRLPERLPPLAALVPFEAAYRLGSFTRAADELALSQASVSRRIRELEGDLGVSLFERRRYDVIPTAEGEALAASVRDALDELARVATRLRAQAQGSESLTIYSDMSLGNALVVPCVGDMQRLYPDLKLRILSSSEPIESIGEEFHIGLQYGRWADDRFEIEPLADDVIFPVCSPELAAQLPKQANAVDIAAMPLLHLADERRKWPDWRNFLAFFRLKEPRPIEGLTFSSYQICLDVAERGEGIALGWGFAVKERLASGNLVRIAGLEMPLPGMVNIYRRKGEALSETAKRFTWLLQARVAGRGK